MSEELKKFYCQAPQELWDTHVVMAHSEQEAESLFKSGKGIKVATGRLTNKHDFTKMELIKID